MQRGNKKRIPVGSTFDSAPSGRFPSCIRNSVLESLRKRIFWRDSTATLTVVRGETRLGPIGKGGGREEDGAGNIAVDCVRALAVPRHTGPRGMSKRLASIVRRSPCYPFHGSPRDSFVRGKSSSDKIQYPPGGAMRSGTAPEGRAIRESACVLSAKFLTSRRKFFRN